MGLRFRLQDLGLGLGVRVRARVRAKARVTCRDRVGVQDYG